VQCPHYLVPVDGGRGEIESAYDEIKLGVGGCNVAQLGEAANNTGVVGRKLPQLTDGHVHGFKWVVMMVGVVLTQRLEGGRCRGGNVRWHPNDYSLVHGDIRTRRREHVGGSTDGEAQPGTAREPRNLEA
jgi:hypothetical protein